MAKDKEKDKKLTKTTTGDADKEFADPDLSIEGTKEPIEETSKAPAHEIVRGEDILKIMRKKGLKI
jgi:hypothetical protein